MRHQRTLVLGVGILVIVILSLQIFLLMVGLEAWLTFHARIAWAAAGTSLALAATSVILYRYLRGASPDRPSARRPRR